MKKDLHPAFVDCQVICACGNKFMTKATIPEIKTELCSKCHPFFTGEQILIDTAGQVDRFQKRVAESVTRQAAKPKKVKKTVEAKPEVKAEESTEDLLKKIKLQMEEDARKKAAKTAKKPAAVKE